MDTLDHFAVVCASRSPPSRSPSIASASRACAPRAGAAGTREPLGRAAIGGGRPRGGAGGGAARRVRQAIAFMFRPRCRRSMNGNSSATMGRALPVSTGVSSAHGARAAHRVRRTHLRFVRASYARIGDEPRGLRGDGRARSRRSPSRRARRDFAARGLSSRDVVSARPRVRGDRRRRGAERRA